jgi:hypothetical protein
MTTEREATAHLRDVREPGGRTRRRFVSVLLGAALVLTACGGGDDGTEISSAIDGVVGSGARTTASAVGLASGDGDVVWKATSTPAQVADSISLAGRPDERTDGTDGAVFMLYKAGTVWLTPIAAGGTAVGRAVPQQRHGVRPPQPIAAGPYRLGVDGEPLPVGRWVDQRRQQLPQRRQFVGQVMSERSRRRPVLIERKSVDHA